MSFHRRELHRRTGGMGLCCILVLCALTPWVSGCKGKAEQPAEPPRAVTVVPLERTDPVAEVALTGSAEAWKQEDIAFEIAGTLVFAVDREQSVIGPLPAPHREGGATETQPPTTDQAREGTVVASLDPARYELAVAGRQADLGAAKAAEDSIVTRIESVLPAKIKAAQAQVELSLREVERIEIALAGGAATDMELDIEQARVKVAQANVEKLEAEIDSVEGERRSAAAKAIRAMRMLELAELDLKRCSLLAPFSGQVTELYSTVGAYLHPGQAVARITMMDPIHVVAAVSADTDREINLGDVVHITPPGSEETIEGFVYTQDTVADPKLRTFKVRIMVRNRLVYVDPPSRDEVLAMITADRFRAFLATLPKAWELHEDPRLRPLLDQIKPGQDVGEDVLVKLFADNRTRTRLIGWLRVKGIIPVIAATPDVSRPLYADVKCIQSDDEGHFVWKAVGSDAATDRAALTPVIQLKKVRVRLGTEQLSLVGLFLFREIKEIVGNDQDAELDVATALAVGVPEWVTDGDRVLRLRQRWLIRPGDMVSVRWAERGPTEGFYVPMAAIVIDPAGAHYVHLAAGGGDDLRAKRVPVTLGDEIGDRRQIEGEGLTEGDRVILHGTSLLSPGDPVRIVQLEEDDE